MTKPVIVRMASGGEYGLRSAADAKRIYPNAEIIRYADGSPYEGEAAAITRADIRSMKRDQLDAVAPDFGINPADFAKVDDLRDAVAGAHEDQGGDPEGDESE